MCARVAQVCVSAAAVRARDRRAPGLGGADPPLPSSSLPPPCLHSLSQSLGTGCAGVHGRAEGERGQVLARVSAGRGQGQPHCQRPESLRRRCRPPSLPPSSLLPPLVFLFSPLCSLVLLSRVFFSPLHPP
eukprot:2763767-Rhodomonas_salina.1